MFFALLLSVSQLYHDKISVSYHGIPINVAMWKLFADFVSSLISLVSDTFIVKL